MKPRAFGLGPALLALAALLPAGPALAIPLGQAQAEVSIWNAPAVSGTRSGRSFVLFPLTAGFVGPGGNEAWARVAYAPAPGAGVLPALGTPGSVSLELGVQARLFMAGALTTTGEVNDPVLQPLWRHAVAAHASYQDQVTFIDPTLPLGAPLNVHLGFYLTSDLCHSGVPVGAVACLVQPPQAFLDIPAQGVHPQAFTQLASTVVLPTGPDRAERLQPQPRGPLVAAASPLAGNSLDHHFTVANGSTVDWTLQLDAQVQLDARDWLDPLNPDRALFGTIKAYEDLDYLGTLHLGTLAATDANGQPRPGFQMRDSFGWALAPQPAPAVPEPGTLALWLSACTLLAWRRAARRASAWVLLAACGLASAQQTGVSGRIDGNLGGRSFSDITYLQSSATRGVADGVQVHDAIQDPFVTFDRWADLGVQSLASAGFGHVGVQVGGTVDVGALAGNGSVRAEAQARFQDFVTITPSDPSLLGTWGRFSYLVEVAGNGGIEDRSPQGSAQVVYGGLGLPGGGWTSDWIGQGLGDPSGQALPLVARFERFTVFGAPTFIELQLQASLEILVQENRVDAFADLSHTATWAGITSMSTLDGTPLADDAWTIASASGTDYRHALSPVPEPGRGTLAWLGLAAMAWWWRRLAPAAARA